MRLFRKKDILRIHEDQEQNKLKRELTMWDLTLLGIGAIIGTGIFVLIGQGALTAGPALMISFIIAAIACAFSAMAYAEFASIVPISGSVYTYMYYTLGEFVAWMIGWDLVLEYVFAISSVSAGWSGYFQSLLSGFGLKLPDALTAAPGSIEGVQTFFNLPAFLIVLAITFLLSRGISESKKVNNVMVLIKVAVILLFIIAGIGYVKPENWQPFAPFGYSGVLTAAALVFFAYIGFDAVAAAAEETRNPKKDLPRGILMSLAACTLLYVLVAFVTTGVIPYQMFNLDVDHPVSLAIQQTGQHWIAGFIDLGAILGMTTVILVLLYGQIRIFYAMSRDGLLPKAFSTIHPKYRTPVKTTWGLGLVAGLLGALFPLGRLAELVNIGTLFAFTMVSFGVLVLRKTRPNLSRPFRCPGVPVVPTLGMLACILLMFQLRWLTWVAFLVWFGIGILVYFFYSRKHSLLDQEADLKVKE